MCVHMTSFKGVTRGERATGEALRALFSRTFCPCESRQLALWYLPARWRDTTTQTGTLNLYAIFPLQYPFGKIPGSVYWKPVYNLLEDTFTVFLVNAAHVKNVPRRKTDKADARWLAKLMRFGLLQASFIPPKGQRDLRDLTRYRTKLVQERVREVNRGPRGAGTRQYQARLSDCRYYGRLGTGYAGGAHCRTRRSCHDGRPGETPHALEDALARASLDGHCP